MTGLKLLSSGQDPQRTEPHTVGHTPMLHSRQYSQTSKAGLVHGVFFLRVIGSLCMKMGVQEHHVSCFCMFSNILLFIACLLTARFRAWVRWKWHRVTSRWGYRSTLIFSLLPLKMLQAKFPEMGSKGFLPTGNSTCQLCGLSEVWAVWSVRWELWEWPELHAAVWGVRYELCEVWNVWGISCESWVMNQVR